MQAKLDAINNNGLRQTNKLTTLLLDMVGKISAMLQGNVMLSQIIIINRISFGLIRTDKSQNEHGFANSGFILQQSNELKALLLSMMAKLAATLQGYVTLAQVIIDSISCGLIGTDKSQNQSGFAN